MENKERKLSPRKAKFYENYKGLNENELLVEILFAQELIYDRLNKLENIRSNTSNLVWLVIAPIIIALIIGFFSIVGLSI